MAANRPGNTRTASGTPPRSSVGDSWQQAGGTALAGVLLIINGILGVLQGIAAIHKDTVYAVTQHYVFRFNITAWGWIILVLGAVILLVGLAILARQTWAQFTGVGIAAVSMALQFMFLPYYPTWALIAIALDAFIIWALLMTNTHTDI
jgi:hypothetical protein